MNEVTAGVHLFSVVPLVVSQIGDIQHFCSTCSGKSPVLVGHIIICSLVCLFLYFQNHKNCSSSGIQNSDFLFHRLRPLCFYVNKFTAHVTTA